jgi:hypothetical protein
MEVRLLAFAALTGITMALWYVGRKDDETA